MKHAIFTVSMPGSTPREAVERIRAYGGHGVEWRITKDTGDTANPGFWSGNRCTLQADWPDARFKEVAALTREAGLEVPNLGTYLSAEDLAGVERLMEVARLFGAPSLRVGLPGYNGSVPYPVLLEKSLALLAPVVDLARQSGVKAILETHHGTILPSASAAWRLVSPFPPEHLGVLYDPGNMVHEGYETYAMGLELLGRHLAHVHVKNARVATKPLAGPQRAGAEVVWSPLRCGSVDFARFLNALRSVGYDRWLSVENFSQDMPEDERLRDDLAFLREMDPLV